MIAMGDLVQVRSLDPAEVDDWALFPEVMARLSRFAAQDGHGVAHVMVEAFRQWTAPMRGERAAARVWVATVGTHVVGHCVAEVARESDHWHINVAQLEMDRGFAWTLEQEREVLAAVRAWGVTMGVHEVRCTTRSPELAKAFARLGFVDTGRRVLVLGGET